MHPAESSRRMKESHPENWCSSPRCLWNTRRSGPCPKHKEKALPLCPACRNPIIPGDMTEPYFTLEGGEQRVHWDCAHGDELTPDQADQKGAADSADYSGYCADKGVRR